MADLPSSGGCMVRDHRFPVPVGEYANSARKPASYLGNGASHQDLDAFSHETLPHLKIHLANVVRSVKA